MLQEAGIASRYLRVEYGIEFKEGYISWQGRHAIVEADIERDGTFGLLLDSHQKAIGTKRELDSAHYDGNPDFAIRQLLGLNLLDNDEQTAKFDLSDSELMSKHAYYAIPPEHANMVWRPKSNVE